MAIVHESLSALGGAERVVRELAQTFPDAPVFTLEGSANLLPTCTRIATSFLQRIPSFVRRRRWALPLYPIAPETFDLSGYDVVISSSSAFAKGIVTRPGTLHICYCHAPTRFLWDWTQEMVSAVAPGTIRRGILQLTLHSLRLWDQAAARRVDVFLANSAVTRDRIRKYYHREALVIYPPVSFRFPEPFAALEDTLRQGSMNEVSWRAPKERSNPRAYFLFVGRLSPYKQADLVIETFNKLELPLVVAGAGRDLARLRALAGPTVTLRGFVSETELPGLYQRARAVVFASDDDFGMVPVEAMAAGTPVLALRRGGATETVVEGITGEFFDEPLEELLADCVRRFLTREGSYEPARLRAHAEQYSVERFRFAVRAAVTEAWERWSSSTSSLTESLPPRSRRQSES